MKGMGIDEAIELITGPKNKPVKLFLEEQTKKGIGKTLRFVCLEILLKFLKMNLLIK